MSSLLSLPTEEAQSQPAESTAWGGGGGRADSAVARGCPPGSRLALHSRPHGFAQHVTSWSHK